MLQIERVEFAYDDSAPATMCFELEVAAGEVVSLIGPSGSGKSTLLGLIAGFLPQRRGRILIDAEPIQDMGVAERPVSMVFQQHNLFPHLDLYFFLSLYCAFFFALWT